MFPNAYSESNRAVAPRDGIALGDYDLSSLAAAAASTSMLIAVWYEDRRERSTSTLTVSTAGHVATPAFPYDGVVLYSLPTNTSTIFVNGSWNGAGADVAPSAANLSLAILPGMTVAIGDVPASALRTTSTIATTPVVDLGANGGPLSQTWDVLGYGAFAFTLNSLTWQANTMITLEVQGAGGTQWTKVRFYFYTHDAKQGYSSRDGMKLSAGAHGLLVLEDAAKVRMTIDVLSSGVGGAGQNAEIRLLPAPVAYPLTHLAEGDYLGGKLLATSSVDHFQTAGSTYGDGSVSLRRGIGNRTGVAFGTDCGAGVASYASTPGAAKITIGVLCRFLVTAVAPTDEGHSAGEDLVIYDAQSTSIPGSPQTIIGLVPKDAKAGQVYTFMMPFHFGAYVAATNFTPQGTVSFF